MIGQIYCLDQDPSGNDGKHIAEQTAPLVARMKKLRRRKQGKAEFYSSSLGSHTS